MFAVTPNLYRFRYLITGVSGPGIEQVHLPEQPPDSKIHYKKEQKFIAPQPSEQLSKWMKEALVARLKNPEYLHAHQKEINAWEDQEFERSRPNGSGFWFWNNGVATWITPFYYWVLTTWNPYFGKPTYRETDKEITYWILFWENDPDSFGGALNTIRRYGKSSIMGAWIVWRTTKNFNHTSGMQGETDKKIAAFYRKMILKPFYKLRSYHQPTYNMDSKQATKIEFDIPPRRSVKRTQESEEQTVLESIIDYRPSGEGEYDGEILHSYIMEEPGKCHGKDTPILMFDGSLKMIQDVSVNDLLMGDDSTPRVVKELIRGTGKIYRVVSTNNKKAKSWTVTEEHILSCKVSGGTRFKGYKRGDVMNLTVKEYLKLNAHQQRHLNCYRVAVEYLPAAHKIDPYFLGIWLGDGSHEGSSVGSEDKEIVDYIYEFAKANRYGVSFTHPNKQKEFKVFYLSGGLRALLKLERLTRNKHIPNPYLIDSRENRLQLLAGLIDTDGHRDAKKGRPNQRSYEIIQKRKDLAFQIQNLALSLGFYASCKAKIATMKRKDGTIYRNTVHRVMIYGTNLHEIPCKVERKKMPHDIIRYNSKDPKIYGFDVQFDKVDKFYGVNVTGNKLYLLGDYTVTHNCQKVSLYDEEGEGRWDIIKPCFLQGGEEIIGKCLMGTTVENLKVVDRGGQAYMRLFYDSDYNKREEDGRTMSGLYAAFLPGDCALKGYMDEWGHPKRDEARAYLLKVRKSYKNRPSKLAGWIRKYPIYLQEIFYVNPDGCEFNVQVLNERETGIMSSAVPLVDRIDFDWHEKKRDTKVIWRHNPDNGWCQVARGVGFADMPNNLIEEVGYNPETGVKLWRPKNTKIVAGCDPIQHGVVVQAGRASKPVLLVKSKYDPLLDGPYPDQETLEKNAENKYPYLSNRYILMFDKRPTDPNKFFEYALMICVYFGIPLHVESQKNAIISYFHARGYGEFILLKYRPEFAKPDSKPIEGTPASQPLIQEYTSKVATWIEYFGHTMPFLEVIKDNKVFKPLETKVHDYTVSQGMTELACDMKPKVQSQPVEEITHFMPKYDRFGNIVN